MKMMFSLIKLQLNSSFGISALKYRFTREKRRRWEPVLIGLSIFLGMGTLLAFYTMGMAGLFIAGKGIGQPEIIITLGFLAAQLFILIFGLYYILGTFYFSKDMEALIPLPLKPYQVIGSKFAVVMIYEYMTAFPIILPPIIIYGLGTGRGIIYWIKGLVLILASPAIPLIIGAVFVLILMRIINLRRNKDLLTIITGIASLLVALAFNFLFRNIPDNAGIEYFQGLLESRSGLINAIGQKFPPAIWATMALSRENLPGLLHFFLFIAVSVLMITFMLWLSNIVFYKAFLAGREVSKGKGGVSLNSVSRYFNRARSPVAAILSREWKLLLRTPVYIINGLTGIIIGPFIVIIFAFSRGESEESRLITQMLADPGNALYIMLAGLGLMLFTSGINVAASTAVSREGRNFWIAKMIPVPGRRQITAKFLHGYMVSVIGIIASAIAFAVFPGLSAGKLLFLSVTASICSVSMTALSLLIDLVRPKLTWNSEQEAMKQNLNGALGMLVSFTVIIMLAAAAIIPMVLEWSGWTSFALLLAIAIILDVASLAVLLHIADKKYQELES